MNLALRRSAILQHTLRRTYATAFIPPSQLRGLNDANFLPEDDGKLRPESSSFYTTKPTYYDQTAQIEKAIASSRKALTSLQLLPLPQFARDALPPLIPAWKSKEAMSNVFGTKLTTSRYRKVTALLNQLNNFQRIATSAGCLELARGIAQVASMFESGNKDAILSKNKQKPAEFDQYGRTYSFGKRKTSTARVWMIPTKQQDVVFEDSSTHTPVPKESIESLLGIDASKLEAESSSSASSVVQKVTPTTVLINNIPLAEYFPLTADRERIIRPLKLAGALGAYNVFSIVRGGGSTGQSGAVAHGIAKGVAAHVPDMGDVLRKAKLLRRDPRMVERKKTGLAKARKRYTWVKR